MSEYVILNSIRVLQAIYIPGNYALGAVSGRGGHRTRRGPSRTLRGVGMMVVEGKEGCKHMQAVIRENSRKVVNGTLPKWKVPPSSTTHSAHVPRYVEMCRGPRMFTKAALGIYPLSGA